LTKKQCHFRRIILMETKLHGWDDEKVYFWDEEQQKEWCVSDEKELYDQLVETCIKYFREKINKEEN